MKAMTMRNTAPSTWILDHAVMVIKTQLTGPEAVEMGVFSPYSGFLYKSDTSELLYSCSGALWSKVRGELESFYYANFLGNEEDVD